MQGFSEHFQHEYALLTSKRKPLQRGWILEKPHFFRTILIEVG